MNVKFDDFLQEQLQDPEFKKEYEALQPRHAIIQTTINSSVLSDAEMDTKLEKVKKVKSVRKQKAFCD